MRKTVFKVFNVLFLVVLLSSFSGDKEKHIGRWSLEENEKHIGYMTLDKEGYVTYEVNGKILGGKESEFKGKKAKITYLVNYSATPFQIDIISTEIETNKRFKHMRGIFEFIGSDKMKMAASNKGDEGARPKDFKGSNVVLMTRVK